MKALNEIIGQVEHSEAVLTQQLPVVKKALQGLFSRTKITGRPVMYRGWESDNQTFAILSEDGLVYAMDRHQSIQWDESGTIPELDDCEVIRYTRWVPGRLVEGLKMSLRAKLSDLENSGNEFSEIAAAAKALGILHDTEFLGVSIIEEQ